MAFVQYIQMLATFFIIVFLFQFEKPLGRVYRIEFFVLDVLLVVSLAQLLHSLGAGIRGQVNLIIAQTPGAIGVVAAVG